MNGLFDDQPMFNEFELETAQLLAREHGRDEANQDDMKKATALVKRWNKQRRLEGLENWK